MIISRRPTASIYSVNPIAQSVSSSLAASARIVSRPQPETASAKMNLAFPYPSLFVSRNAASPAAKKAA